MPSELEQESGITGEEQNRIREAVVKASGAPDNEIDGSGCDSGDPVDLTLSEIAQGFNFLKARLALLEKVAEAAGRCRSGLDAYDELSNALDALKGGRG